MSFMLPSAINLPAQTFHQTLPALVPILQRYVMAVLLSIDLPGNRAEHSRYSHVVFHCSSSQGRGPRCASWYQDALEAKEMKVNAYVLSGGIKAYHGLYPQNLIAI